MLLLARQKSRIAPSEQIEIEDSWFEDFFSIFYQEDLFPSSSFLAHKTFLSGFFQHINFLFSPLPDSFYFELLNTINCFRSCDDFFNRICVAKKFSPFFSTFLSYTQGLTNTILWIYAPQMIPLTDRRPSVVFCLNRSEGAMQLNRKSEHFAHSVVARSEHIFPLLFTIITLEVYVARENREQSICWITRKIFSCVMGWLKWSFRESMFFIQTILQKN